MVRSFPVDAKEHLIAAEKLIEASEATLHAAQLEAASAISSASAENQPAIAAAAVKLNAALEDIGENLEDAISGAKKLVSDVVPDVIEDNVIFVYQKVVEPVFGDFVRFLNARGSIVDVSLGLIVGRQMQLMFSATVEDIFKPLFGMLGITAAAPTAFRLLRPGRSGKSTYESLAAARADGALVLATGHFRGAVTDFFSMALALFFMAKVFGMVQRYRARTEVKVGGRKCGRCLESVNG
jgi:large-conductance mechanosensitive channel